MTIKSGVARALAGIEQSKLKKYPNETTYTLRAIDQDGSLMNLLKYLQEQGNIGHSVSFKIDDKDFGWDGDGSDKILDMKIVKPEPEEAAAKPASTFRRWR